MKSFEFKRASGYTGGRVSTITAKRDSQCGCRKAIPSGTKCLEFSASGTYPIRICRRCASKLAKVIAGVL